MLAPDLALLARLLDRREQERTAMAAEVAQLARQRADLAARAEAANTAAFAADERTRQAARDFADGGQAPALEWLQANARLASLRAAASEAGACAARLADELAQCDLRLHDARRQLALCEERINQTRTASDELRRQHRRQVQRAAQDQADEHHSAGHQPLEHL